ncbi:MAG: hypothetical protein BGO12_08755 [Verrucomicrobia bacterium 61-8]|nr:MAG: hypothetical protein BGO12_08755 [Verrucomicrobia bacterium 61-8]
METLQGSRQSYPTEVNRQSGRKDREIKIQPCQSSQPQGDPKGLQDVLHMQVTIGIRCAKSRDFRAKKTLSTEMERVFGKFS